MLRVLVVVSMLFVSFVSQKMQAQQSVTVTVENVTSNKGKVGFAIFNKENFIKKPIQGVYTTIENGKSTFTFKNIPIGEYAITAFHDLNDNKKMDFSPHGMPIEDYGVSNNTINRFGPPIFEDAKFKVADKNVNISIRF